MRENIYIYKPTGALLEDYDGNAISVSVKYVAQTMGVGYVEVSCSDIQPLDFSVGCYIKWGKGKIASLDHFFYLYTIPQPQQSEYLSRYDYSGIVFYDAGAVLKRALWTDLKVEGDNLIHYSTREGLSTYENVAGIASRLQACIDFYLETLPDDTPFKNYTFTVSVADYQQELPAEGDTTKEGFKALAAEARQFSFSDNDTVFDALNRIAEVWPTIGWCYDITRTSVSVVIGEPNFIPADHLVKLGTSRDEEDYTLFDVGDGLAGIKKYIINTDEYCSRLVPFGSDRNLPTRYYNSKTIYNNDGILNGQSDDIAHLMIPVSKWGTTTGKWDWSDTSETARLLPDPRKAVIENAGDRTVDIEPVTRIVRFDNDENGDIYPSLSGVTVQDLWDAMTSGEQYRPSASVYGGSNEVDVIAGASDAKDDGIIPAGGTLTDNCNITIPQIGFDIKEYVADTGIGVINMLTGKCAGRSFTIKSRTYQSSVDNWLLNIERVTDSSTGMVYPNTTYPISVDDKFVLTDIQMPDLYVSLAEVRLFNAALKYFKRNCAYRYLYDIELDNVWIAENMNTAKHFADKGYHIVVRLPYLAGNRPLWEEVFLLIDTLTITDGESAIPTYSVTTKENLYVPEVEDTKKISVSTTASSNVVTFTATVSPTSESVTFTLVGGTYTTAPTLVDNGDNTATLTFHTDAGNTDTASVTVALVSDPTIFVTKAASYTSEEPVDIDPLSTEVNISLLKSWLRTSLGISSSTMTPQALVFANSASGNMALLGTAGGMSFFSDTATSGTRFDISSMLNSTWHSNSLFVNPSETYESGCTQTVWTTEWDGTQALAALKVELSTSAATPFSLKQKITPTPSAKVGLGYRDWAIDFDGGYLWSVAYSKADTYVDDGSNEMVIAKYVLPTGSDVTLTDADVLDSFTLPVVEVRQGIMFYKNHLYIAHGAKNVSKNTMGVTDISLLSKSVVAEVDVMSAVSSYIDEIQNVFWYNGKLCICGNSSSRRYVRVMSLY